MVARSQTSIRVASSITGLSAGGAMTSVMLATYPEVFAAGAIIAGLPFGIASNLREALNGMLQSPSRPAERAGRSRAPGIQAQGPVAESVGVARQRRSHRQSRQCQRDRQAMARRARSAARADVGADVDGYPRQVWWNADGETIVESYTITDMAHGTPLGIADNDERYGAKGAFLIEAGISSSYHIAKFFGLTERVRVPGEVVKEVGAGRLQRWLQKKRRSRSRCRSPKRQAVARAHGERRRSQQHHYPRADRRGPDEVAARCHITPARFRRSVRSASPTTSPPATCRVFSV